ncbi:hypothetical protein ACWD3I_30660 [Streptomyces sp. NPDC002817]|uniref:hypothetical protein n=1 Tax=Streptomyces sp. NPDC088357 TaxID=3154655 RepID=UPI0034184B8D
MRTPEGIDGAVQYVPVAVRAGQAGARGQAAVSGHGPFSWSYADDPAVPIS